jgi:hypothetical protein
MSISNLTEEQLIFQRLKFSEGSPEARAIDAVLQLRQKNREVELKNREVELKNREVELKNREVELARIQLKMKELDFAKKNTPSSKKKYDFETTRIFIMSGTPYYLSF